MKDILNESKPPKLKNQNNNNLHTHIYMSHLSRNKKFSEKTARTTTAQCPESDGFIEECFQECKVDPYSIFMLLEKEEQKEEE
jgi:hypothetical protein